MSKMWMWETTHEERGGPDVSHTFGSKAMQRQGMAAVRTTPEAVLDLCLMECLPWSNSFLRRSVERAGQDKAVNKIRPLQRKRWSSTCNTASFHATGAIAGDIPSAGNQKTTHSPIPPALVTSPSPPTTTTAGKQPLPNHMPQSPQIQNLTTDISLHQAPKHTPLAALPKSANLGGV